MVVEILKSTCLNRAMITSSLVADFKSHEAQRMIAHVCQISSLKWMSYDYLIRQAYYSLDRPEGKSLSDK